MLSFQAILVIAAAINSVFAASQKAAKRYATFDELPQPAVDAPLAELGPYKGLTFHALDLVALGISGSVIAGVKPASSPNVVAYGLLQQNMQGTPSLQATFPTKRFALRSFFFGCGLMSENGAASSPIACRLTVTGFYNDKQVGQVSFSFLPGNLAAEMVRATMPKKLFGSLTLVQFSTVPIGTAGAPVVATGLDSLQYITYR